MNKIKELFMKNIGVSILVILVFIFIVFTLIYIFFGNNISVIEENKIKSDTKIIANYLDDIASNKTNSKDKYILFALDYNNSEYHKNEMTVEEIVNFIKEYFTIKLKEEDLINTGITPLLVDRHIVYDVDKKSFKMNDSSVNVIKYYKIEKIKKLNKKKYRATYREYTITDVVEMLNYYLKKNNETEGIVDENGNYTYNLKDIEPIRNYILGSGNILDIKNSIDDDVENYSKKGGTIKVTYVVEDDKVLIDSVK